MLKKSCWKVVTKPWIDGFMDWIEWPAQQMTEEAKVWIDHHRRSIIEHWLTLFLHEFLISSLDTINYSTWWSTGPDDKSYSELDCYLHLFYDTHLSSASLDSIVMKKKTTKQIFRQDSIQSSPIKTLRSLEISTFENWVLYNHEFRAAALIKVDAYILARGHPDPPKMQNKETRRWQIIISSSSFSLLFNFFFILRLFENTLCYIVLILIENLLLLLLKNCLGKDDRMLNMCWPPRNPLLRSWTVFLESVNFSNPNRAPTESSSVGLLLLLATFCYFKNQFAMKHTALCFACLWFILPFLADWQLGLHPVHSFATTLKCKH